MWTTSVWPPPRLLGLGDAISKRQLRTSYVVGRNRVGIQFIRIGREVFRVLGLLWLIPVSTAFYFFSIKLQI